MKFIQTDLHQIVVTDLQTQQVIVLQETGGERKFAIVIGNAETDALKRRLEGIRFERPLTHDLLASVLQTLGGTIERIEITELKNRTYHALLHIRQGEQIHKIDCRPSDAIVLGAATMMSIYVAEPVLEASLLKD